MDHLLTEYRASWSCILVSCLTSYFGHECVVGFICLFPTLSFPDLFLPSFSLTHLTPLSSRLQVTPLDSSQPFLSSYFMTIVTPSDEEDDGDSGVGDDQWLLCDHLLLDHHSILCFSSVSSFLCHLLDDENRRQRERDSSSQTHEINTWAEIEGIKQRRSKQK